MDTYLKNTLIEKVATMERTWQAFLTLPYRSKSEYKALITGFDAGYEAGQRAERERIVELEEFIRSLESFQSKTLDGYTYHDGFGEEMKEICDMRTKSVLGSGRDLLNAFDAVPKNFK